MLISVKGKGKNQLDPYQTVGDAPVLSHCSLLRNLDHNQPECWSVVMNETPTVGSPFFRVFPSDCISKAMNDVGVLYETEISFMQRSL